MSDDKFYGGLRVGAAGAGGGGGAAGAASIANKGMPALLTAADFALACATAIASTPNGYVGVCVNGVLQSVGNGVRTASCYFSADSGATARAYGAVQAGDLLYWVGTVAGFQLATTDVIDFLYNS